MGSSGAVERQVSALSNLLGRMGSNAAVEPDLETPLINREPSVPLSQSAGEAKVWPALRMSSVSNRAPSHSVVPGEMVR